MNQNSMNSMDIESKYNIDKHIEFIDNEYDHSNGVALEALVKKKIEQKLIEQPVIVNSDDEGIPEEFKHFKSIKEYKNDLKLHQTINSSLGLRKDFNHGKKSFDVLNNMRENVSNERTRKKIEHFDETIYDQQKVRENESMLRNDFNRKNVDWSGPPCLQGPPGTSMNYCQGFMSSTNDQLIDHYTHRNYQDPNGNPDFIGLQPFAIEYYAAQYEQFMAEQYYLNEKRIMTQ
jgi:hypothetical protein